MNIQNHRLFHNINEIRSFKNGFGGEKVNLEVKEVSLGVKKPGMSPKALIGKIVYLEFFQINSRREGFFLSSQEFFFLTGLPLSFRSGKSFPDGKSLSGILPHFFPTGTIIWKNSRNFSRRETKIGKISR